MISISLSNSSDPKEHTKFKEYEPSCIESLADVILNCSWSPCVFKHNYRKKQNFLYADYIALDFDDGWPLSHAIGTCRAHDLTHIIATSKSHQIPKHGNDVWDRYRIVFPLERRITTVADYSATWHHVWRLFSRRADKAAKDPARFFFPCKALVSLSQDMSLDVVSAEEVTHAKMVKRIISKSTPLYIDEVLRGVRVEGERNSTVLRASQIMAGASWEEEDIVARIKMAGCSLGDDEIRRTVRNGVEYVRRGQ